MPRGNAVDLHRLHELDRQPGVVAALCGFILRDRALEKFPAPLPASQPRQPHAAKDQPLRPHPRDHRADAGARAEREAAEVEIGKAKVPDQIVEIIDRSEEHTSELQSLMRTSYAVFCLK